VWRTLRQFPAATDVTDRVDVCVVLEANIAILERQALLGAETLPGLRLFLVISEPTEQAILMEFGARAMLLRVGQVQ
jgi:hypothetical protein